MEIKWNLLGKLMGWHQKAVILINDVKILWQNYASQEPVYST